MSLQAVGVLGDPVRRRIMEVLAQGESSSGDIVTVIQGEFGITQSAVSQHLKVLRDNGFATVRGEGTRRLYSIDGAALSELDAWLGQFRSAWLPTLDALATEVARGKRKRGKEAARKVKQPHAAARRKSGTR